MVVGADIVVASLVSFLPAWSRARDESVERMWRDFIAAEDIAIAELDRRREDQDRQDAEARWIAILRNDD